MSELEHRGEGGQGFPYPPLGKVVREHPDTMQAGLLHLELDLQVKESVEEGVRLRAKSYV